MGRMPEGYPKRPASSMAGPTPPAAHFHKQREGVKRGMAASTARVLKIGLATQILSDQCQLVAIVQRTIKGMRKV
jgi:hypothetical protein